MGMFDCIECELPLPGLPPLWEPDFQTKSFEAENLDLYEIRADGSLWRQEYDTEDRTEKNAVGLDRWAGLLTKANLRWVAFPHTGEVRFYDEARDGEWFEFLAVFLDGRIVRPIKRID